MQNRSGLAVKPLLDDSENIISLTEARERRYNPQAAFYALPKAFINRLLFRLSGSTLKVFLALVYHTDCWNVIKYPEKITHTGLMKTTGIKKKETISNAYKELEEHGIIGGYVPGHGADNTKFYFTFDIDHYRSEECCLDLEEISSYYEMLLSGKFTNMPGANPAGTDQKAGSGKNVGLTVVQEDPEPVENVSTDLIDNNDLAGSAGDPADYKNDPLTVQDQLNYILTIENSWNSKIKLYQKAGQGDFFLEDGSLFCDKDEFFKNFKQNIVPDPETDSNFSDPVQNADIACLPGITETVSSEEIPSCVPKNGTVSPQKSVQGSTEKKDSLKTIKSYKINKLIVMAQKDSKFIHEFNNFCVDDSRKYLKNTLYWLIQHAAEYNLSLGDVIDSLYAANSKGKQGKMCYLVGVMRNKAGNNSSGLRVITKPEFVQAKDYFQERFGHCIEYLKFYIFDWKAGEFQYTLKNPENDGPAMKEFFKFAVDDIKKAVGVSLAAVEK